MRTAEHDLHVAFRVSSEHRDALRRIAAGRGITTSALLREMVAVVVESEPDAQPPTLDHLAERNPFIARARRSR
jgi:hypothetical protein